MSVGKLLAELANRGVRLHAQGDKISYVARDAGVLDDTLRAAVQVHREELLKLLSAVHAAPRQAAIHKAPDEVPIRCSPAQERFLFVAELDESSNLYRLNAAFRILGALDVPALRATFRDIVRRHDILRSRFEATAEGFTMLATDWEPSVEIIDFAGAENDLLAATGRANEPEFDLLAGPHLSTTLYRLSPERHVLHVAIHHIVSDGGSIGIFARELCANYAWRSGLTSVAPPEPRFQFRDLAHSERSTALEDAEHLEFWKRDLETAPAALTLPTDRPRPAVRAGVGGSVPVQLDEALLQQLRGTTTAWQLSEFQIIVAALWLMLHTYSGQGSIVIGTPWRNRERPGSQDIIGPLLNLLPLHIRVAAQATVGDLLAEVRDRTLAAIRHGSVPFDRIVSHVCPERSAAVTPVFQVMCAIETTPEDAIRLAGLNIEAVEMPNEAARYDLALVLRHTPDGLRGALKFDRSLFDEATAKRMARHFGSALKLVLGAPTAPVARVQLMDAGELRQVLVDWNRTKCAYPLDKTIVDCFHDVVERWPHRVAVESQGLSLTYRQLDRWADAVARRLLAVGVGLDDVVGVTSERSLEFVVATLGVLKAGAAYLPISARQPPERRGWMLENAGVKAVIGQASSGVPQVQVGDRPTDGDATSAALPGPRPESGCYVIYTSGSTGVPKGVVVDHRAIANNLFWMNAEWPLNESDALLFKSDTGFDVSVKEIFWPLLAGARLVVAPPDANDPERLCEIIGTHRISVVHMVPTMLDFFLRHESPSHIDHLRIVMCGGEALSSSLRGRFHEAFDAMLLHLYGPTEAAIAVTGTAIVAGQPDVERLPLGRPMPNCAIYVVDSALVPVPIGVPGELCIAGTPLARGYLGRPDLTAEKFVPDPFSEVAGSRMYLTGDRARFRADGQIDYLGRIDRQIKLGGVRMEPGEIEAAFRSQAGVDDAVVVVNDNGGRPVLVAYVASRAPDASAAMLQDGVRSKLAASMVPACVVIVPTFPTNVNGKVDVAALQQLHALPARPTTNPPQGEIETAIARIWCSVLKLDNLDRDEDFFELGGHSLLILQVQALLREELGCKIALAKLFLNPTVESLAAHIAASNVERAKQWMKKRLGIGKGSAS